jgi:uncharacterized membrane protein YcjF (UPF0283 family)
MLICFGIAWPFAIYKSYKTREIGSKSFIFLLALLIGYIAGILHKVFVHMDWVIVFYVINGLMVVAELILYLRNRLYHIRKSAEEAHRQQEAKRKVGSKTNDTGRI